MHGGGLIISSCGYRQPSSNIGGGLKSPLTQRSSFILKSCAFWQKENTSVRAKKNKKKQPPINWFCKPMNCSIFKSVSNNTLLLPVSNQIESQSESELEVGSVPYLLYSNSNALKQSANQLIGFYSSK